jgi:hypothetical protein
MGVGLSGGYLCGRIGHTITNRTAYQLAKRALAARALRRLR